MPTPHDTSNTLICAATLWFHPLAAHRPHLICARKLAQNTLTFPPPLGRRVSPLSSCNVKFTGLAQNPQVDPVVSLKISIRALELTQSCNQVPKPPPVRAIPNPPAGWVPLILSQRCDGPLGGAASPSLHGVEVLSICRSTGPPGGSVQVATTAAAVRHRAIA